MSPSRDVPPAFSPRQGRPLAERVCASLRRVVGLSVACLLVLLLGPAGLAAPCAPTAATCQGGDCGASDTTACPGCSAKAAVPRALQGTNDLSSPGAAGCDCEVVPAKAPPARGSAAEGPAERSASHETLLSRSPGSAFEPVRIALAGHVPGSPPEPGEPLHLRNRVLRI